MRGPCTKQTVKATIVVELPGAEARFIGTNYVLNHQETCPRAGFASGVGYELCRDVCRQPAHAEINALEAAGPLAKGATMYVEGHVYACPQCVVAASKAGIKTIVMGPPPQ